MFDGTTDFAIISVENCIISFNLLNNDMMADVERFPNGSTMMQSAKNFVLFCLLFDSPPIGDVS